MIELKNVSKLYSVKNRPGVSAVHDVSLNVANGEFVIITGRSGSGKTTLLNLIAGLARPTAGQVLLDDVEVWKLPDDQQALMRNHKIGFIFQFPSLIPSLNVLENVLLPTILGDKQDKDSAHDRAVKLLEEVGLADKLDSLPRQLSAGQQQRVVIARALINQPELLLADEPTSNLDEQTEAEVMTLLKEMFSKKGITVLLVTHTDELIHYGTRAIRMASGAIVNPPVQVQVTT